MNWPMLLRLLEAQSREEDGFLIRPADPYDERAHVVTNLICSFDALDALLAAGTVPDREPAPGARAGRRRASRPVGLSAPCALRDLALAFRARSPVERERLLGRIRSLTFELALAQQFNDPDRSVKNLVIEAVARDLMPRGDFLCYDWAWSRAFPLGRQRLREESALRATLETFRPEASGRGDVPDAPVDSDGGDGLDIWIAVPPRVDVARPLALRIECRVAPPEVGTGSGADLLVVARTGNHLGTLDLLQPGDPDRVLVTDVLHPRWAHASHLRSLDALRDTLLGLAGETRDREPDLGTGAVTALVERYAGAPFVEFKKMLCCAFRSASVLVRPARIVAGTGRRAALPFRAAPILL